MDRRTLIRLLGTGTAVGVAGCGAAGDDESTASPTATPTQTTDTPMTTATTTESDDAIESGLITVAGGEDVESTVEAITTRIENSPLRLLTTVDHAANAASVDRDLPPTTLLIFGNPEIGTPLMQTARSVAIDLPQKMLVWEDDGEVKVTYNDPQYLASRHGIDGQPERLQQIATALENLATGGS